MNKLQAARIAGAITVIRPEWNPKSIETLILDDTKHLSRRPACDVASALAFVACDPLTKTPARVLEQGPWWPNRTETAPATGTTCPTCRETYMPNPDYTHECRRRTKAERIAVEAQWFRDDLARKRLSHCQHHVPRELCKDCSGDLPAYTTQGSEAAK